MFGNGELARVEPAPPSTRRAGLADGLSSALGGLSQRVWRPLPLPARPRELATPEAAAPAAAPIWRSSKASGQVKRLTAMLEQDGLVNPIAYSRERDSGYVTDDSLSNSLYSRDESRRF